MYTVNISKGPFLIFFIVKLKKVSMPLSSTVELFMSTSWDVFLMCFSKRLDSIGSLLLTAYQKHKTTWVYDRFFFLIIFPLFTNHLKKSCPNSKLPTQILWYLSQFARVFYRHHKNHSEACLEIQHNQKSRTDHEGQKVT